MFFGLVGLGWVVDTYDVSLLSFMVWYFGLSVVRVYVHFAIVSVCIQFLSSDSLPFSHAKIFVLFVVSSHRVLVVDIAIGLLSTLRRTKDVDVWVAEDLSRYSRASIGAASDCRNFLPSLSDFNHLHPALPHEELQPDVSVPKNKLPCSPSANCRA